MPTQDTPRATDGNVVRELAARGLITPPPWLADAVQYIAITGSVAYGVSEDRSDSDLYGFAIPPADYVFPQLRGEIRGFDDDGPRFDQYQQHHIVAVDETGRDLNYDVTIFNIVKFFALALDNNPNMLDALFAPEHCVLYQTKVGRMVRDARRIFLHKGAWPRFRGYARSQLAKLDQNKAIGRRAESIAEHGYDVKYAYHLVRVYLEVEQILEEGDLDVTRNAAALSEIRGGMWSVEKVRECGAEGERRIDELYERSTLREKPDVPAVKRLLLQCLEEHYGDLSACLLRVAPE